MFESANLKHEVDKTAFHREELKLREMLLNAQFEIRQQRRFPVLILIAGIEGAGKGETVNLLNEWMDARYIHTSAFSDPSDEERERPTNWRFWRALPPKGEIGIFFGGWHTMPIVQRVMGQLDDGEFCYAIGEIQRLEKMLCDEGVLLLKYWFHLSKSQQKERLRLLERNPETRFKISEEDWRILRVREKGGGQPTGSVPPGGCRSLPRQRGASAATAGRLLMATGRTCHRHGLRIITAQPPATSRMMRARNVGETRGRSIRAQ